MAENWRIDHDGWSETWFRETATLGGFNRVLVGSRDFIFARDDLTALRPQTGRGCAVCRGQLPSAFQYCFACRSPLQEAVAASEPCQGVPNAGLPEFNLAPTMLADPAAPRETLDLPPGSQFGFATAGLPTRLFAIDRDGGWLHEFDRRQSSWTRLFKVGDSKLPERSWSVAAAAGGLVLSATGHLTLVDLTCGPVPRQVTTVLAPDESCIGGAGVLQNKAMIPVLRAGMLHLAQRKFLRDAKWSFEAVSGFQECDDASTPQRCMLSAPIVTEVSVSWAGAQGYLVATLGDHGIAGVWFNWTGGFEPRLAHRPYADPDGNVWQFGTVPSQSGRRSFGFERMGPNQTRIETVGSAVLANGALACHLATLRHRAWVETSPHNLDPSGLREDEFLVPVQALDPRCAILLIASGQNEALVNAGPKLTTPARAGVRLWDGQTLHDLGMPVNLQALTQIAAFVFDRKLFVYDSDENACSRWQLRTSD